MSVLKEIFEQRDALSSELEAITQAVAGDESLTEEQESRSVELLSQIDALDERIKTEKRNAERANLLAEARALVNTRSAAGPSVEVTDEPMVYGVDKRGAQSHNSWWADQIAVAHRSPLDPVRHESEARLAEWSHQIEREIADGSEAGRKAEGQFRDNPDFRGSNRAEALLNEARARGTVARDAKELRAGIVTGGGMTATAASGGAAFVSPVIMLNQYAPWREYGRAFMDQCNKQPLPDYGMEVYVPAVTGPAGVASQTEAAAVNETDPTFGLLSAALNTLAGQVTISQQQLDRTGPGFAFDVMINDQLDRDYAPKADTYVLTQALANATAQSWAGNTGVFVLSAASGSGGFYGQVSKAKSGIRKLAGTVLNATHLFLDPARYEYIAAWADSNGRALIVPDYAGPFNALGNSGDGDAGIEGATGTRFNGLQAFTDANIPTPASGADQAIVGDLSEVWVFEGAPVHRVLPQTLGQNLQVIVQRYSYLTALIRYPKALTAISGTGMATIAYTN